MMGEDANRYAPTGLPLSLVFVLKFLKNRPCNFLPGNPELVVAESAHESNNDWE